MVAVNDINHNNKILCGTSSVYGIREHQRYKVWQNWLLAGVITEYYTVSLYTILLLVYFFVLFFARFHLGVSRQHWLGRSTNAQANKKTFTCAHTPLIYFALSLFSYCIYYCCCCRLRSPTPLVLVIFSLATFVYCMAS